MKKISITIFLIFVLIKGIFAINQIGPITVSEFDCDKGSQGVRVLFEDTLLSEIAKIQYFTIIERKQVSKILKEIEFQLTGLTEQASAVKLGKMLNAKYIVIGSINKTSMNYIISIRVVSIESGLIIASENVRALDDRDIPTAAKDVSKRIIRRIETYASGKNETSASKSRYDINVVSAILKKKYFEAGDYNRVSDLALTLPMNIRKNLYRKYLKKSAPVSCMLNSIPLFGIGSIINDREYLPITFQFSGLGMIGVAMFIGESDYVIIGGIFLVGGYLTGFFSPFINQSDYNSKLRQALNIDSFQSHIFLKNNLYAQHTIKLKLLSVKF